MAELEGIFGHLVNAAGQGRFEADLLAGPLGGATLHGHPLGFRVAKVTDGAVSLRLHLWHGDAEEQPGFEVHDHGFDLQSFVVAGRIRQQTFDARPDPAGGHAVYSVAYSEGGSVLQRTGHRMILERTDEHLVCAGESYEVTAGQLHAAAPEDCADAVTLVLTRDTGRTPITIGPWNGPETLNARRRQLDERPLSMLGLAGALALGRLPLAQT